MKKIFLLACVVGLFAACDASTKVDNSREIGGFKSLPR